MSVLVAGSIAIDNIKTPHAEGESLLGGSASYASLAARFFCPDVRLVGIVGHDFPKQHLEMLEGRGINLEGIEHSDGESFTWTGEYMENMNERVTHKVAVNVLEDWKPALPTSFRDAKWVVLANMAPENQLQVMDQCGPEAFTVADSMDLWINIANAKLHEVLRRVDLFVINDSEARELTSKDNLIAAGRELRNRGPAFVVIKLGEHGAFLFGDSQEHFFSCAAWPLEVVHDPTGAGDTFLGALTGHLAATVDGKPGFDEVRQAVVRGTIMASFTCEAFSTVRLESLDDDQIAARLERFREYTGF